MTKRIDKIREALIDDVFSMTELENIMEGFGYMPIEEEGSHCKGNHGEENLIVLKFTNGASNIIIEPESYEDDCMIIGQKGHDGKKSSVNISSRRDSKPTRVRVFQSYEDLTAVLDYFKEHKQYDYWLMGWLCTSLGRRIGDVISMKWSDLFKRNGSFQYRLETLKEEKTGKVVGALINALAQEQIKEYCAIMGIDPMRNYQGGIFIKHDGEHLANAQKNKYEGFRAALAEAVKSAGITYPVGTHSFRKWYANTLFWLHPYDAGNLKKIQMILGHSNEVTTAVYIEELDRQIDKYNVDYADYMLNKAHGKDAEINNSPVVSFRTEDFRNILSLCWDKAQSGAEKYDGLNAILGMAEKLML